MSALLGTSIWVFIAITVVVAGGAAWMTGQAIAGNWRPAWQLVPYTLLLGVSDRFLTYALFDGEILSTTGYAIDTVVIGFIAAVAFRVTRVRRMTAQYPWLYVPHTPLTWRERDTSSPPDAAAGTTRTTGAVGGEPNSLSCCHDNEKRS